MIPPRTIGSLFSGIGGLDLGVESATGARTIWQVEREEFCRDVLAKHWPDAVRYDDVCTVGDGLAPVDCIIGGFPCQDVSLAGKRAGFGGERSSLWREYRRIVASVRPRFVFVENVPGLLTADDGWAFGEVLGDLAALGFDAEWGSFRASDVGAPHRRERVFLLAYRHGERCELERSGGLLDGQRSALGHDAYGRGGADARRLADAIGWGRDGRSSAPGWDVSDGAKARWEEGADRTPDRSEKRLADDGAQPRVGRDADGLPTELDAHRWPAGRGEAQHDHEPPRTASGVPMRAARLKALGNAVVPQCAALAWRVLFDRAREASS